MKIFFFYKLTKNICFFKRKGKVDVEKRIFLICFLWIFQLFKVLFSSFSSIQFGINTTHWKPIQYLSHTKSGRCTRCLTITKAITIKKLTTPTVIITAISPLLLLLTVSWLNDLIVCSSDGITTRNDIFETSTSGSNVLLIFLSRSVCRRTLFVVWSSAQFIGSWNRYRNIEVRIFYRLFSLLL